MNRTNAEHYRSDVTSRLTVLEEGIDRIEEEQNRLFGRLDEVIKELNSKGKTNWAYVLTASIVFITACGLGFTMLLAGLSLLWFLVNSQMVNVTNPIRSDLAATALESHADAASVSSFILPKLSEHTSQNSRSEQDRHDIAERLGREQDKVSTLQAEIGNIAIKLQEIETQFSKGDDNRNIQWSEQQRWNGHVEDSLSMMKAPFPPAVKGPWYQPQTSKPGPQ